MNHGEFGVYSVNLLVTIGGSAEALDPMDPRHSLAPALRQPFGETGSGKTTLGYLTARLLKDAHTPSSGFSLDG